MPVRKKTSAEQEDIALHQYFPVYYFMFAGALMLDGLHLLIFAIVFNYWRQGNTLFASNGALANFLKCRRETVNRVLKDLTNMKYIQRLSNKAESGAWQYTINEATMCGKITGWSDIKSQTCVTNGHTILCGNITPPVTNDNIGMCESDTHIINDKKTTNKTNNIEDNNVNIAHLLPESVRDDEESKRLWNIVLGLPKWKGRSTEALTEAARILDDHPVEVCREMLRNTISGGYTAIFDPSPEIIAKAKKAACEEKSQTDQPSYPQQTDNEVIRHLYPYFPEELKEAIYSGKAPSSSQTARGLRFCPANNDGIVIIICTYEVQEWLISIHEKLDVILAKWAGDSYTGYEFATNQ